MPFGMICQSALKYLFSITVVLFETAIAADIMSSRFWKYGPKAAYVSERSKYVWNVPMTGQSDSSIARSGRTGVSGECTCTMSYRPSRSTLRTCFRMPRPIVIRACDWFM